jgi:hypothetical protein
MSSVPNLPRGPAHSNSHPLFSFTVDCNLLRFRSTCKLLPRFLCVCDHFPRGFLKRFFSTPQIPDQLWVIPILLYSGYRWFIPGGKAAWTCTWSLTYLLTYGAEPFLRSRQLCSHSRISQLYLKSRRFNTVFTRAPIGPYPEPYESNPHHPILSL